MFNLISNGKSHKRLREIKMLGESVTDISMNLPRKIG
jgi:hypothetical protein